MTAISSEANQDGEQKSPQLPEWAITAGSWIIPISLATVMAGQIFFAAIKFYWGIEHPAWLFWGLLVAGVTTAILRGVSSIKLTILDIAMISFVAVLVASSLVRGLGSPSQSLYYIAAFILLPFLAGRLLDTGGITRFLKAIICIVFAAIPLVGIGLLNLPESELTSDRISALFITYDSLNVAGVSTIPFVSTAFGLLLVLMVSSSTRPKHWNWRLSFSTACMCIAIWFLMFAGTRGGIFSALLVSIVLLAVAHASISRRIGLLLILLSAMAISWMALPNERKAHFGQVSSIQKDAGPIQKEAGPIQKDEDSICNIYGNSPATRLHYYASALKLFLGSPWLGIGAGNYGFKYCGSSGAFISPHSILLQVLAELGLSGAMVYLMLMGITLYSLIRTMMRDSGQRRQISWMLISIWLFFFLQDQISGNYFTSFHFYATTGLASGLMAHQLSSPDVSDLNTVENG